MNRVNSLAILTTLVCALMVSVAVLCGQQDSPERSAEKPKPSEAQVHEAKVSVAGFAKTALCKRVEGVPRPLLPDVPTNVLASLTLLNASGDKDSLADVAAVLVRYAMKNQEEHGSGTPMNPKHTLVEMFISSVNPKLPGDEIVSSSLAEWICKNRSQLAESETLDKEIAKYQALVRHLQKKYSKMAGRDISK